jgi:hypothetical protein
MPPNRHDRKRRAELAAELGFYPASLAPEDIERHRRLNAALNAAPSMERISGKFAHLREEKRRADIERGDRTRQAIGCLVLDARRPDTRPPFVSLASNQQTAERSRKVRGRAARTPHRRRWGSWCRYII